MMRRNLWIGLWVVGIAISMVAIHGDQVVAQTVPANVVAISNNGGALTTTWNDTSVAGGPQMNNIFAVSGGVPFLDFNGPNGSIMRLNGDSPIGGLFSIDANGVLVGGFGGGQRPLHVFTDGTKFNGISGVLIQDVNSTEQFRNLLSMQNRGGVSVQLLDTGTALGTEANYTLDNFSGRMNIFDNTTGTFGLGMAVGPKRNVEVHGNGLGLGTFTPTSALHVFADSLGVNAGDSSTITAQVAAPAITRPRTMMNLVNNGSPVMTFTDTSTNSTWFFSNTNDELNLRKGGIGLNPAIVVENDGEFRFVRDNDGQPARLKIDASGNLEITGQVKNVSDRAKKENFSEVDTTDVLEKVVSMPVSTWNYIDDEKKAKHMGPMAQDFHAAFDLGDDKKMIGAMDKSGVTLAAIQGLNKKVESKNATIADLSQKVENQSNLIDEQNALIDELTQRLERLESLVAPEQK